MATQNGGGGLRRVAATLPPPPLPPGGVRSVPLSPAPGSDVITLAQPRPDGVRVRNDYIETPLRPADVTVASAALAGTKGINAHTLPLVTGSDRKQLTDIGFGRATSSLPGVHGGGASHHLLHSTTSSSSSSSSTPRQQRHNHSHHHQHFDHFQHRPLNQLQVPTVIKQQPTANHRTTSSAAATTTTTFKKEKDAAAANDDGGGSGNGGGDDGHATTDASSSSIICGRCRKCRCDACRNPKRLPSAWLCQNKYQCSAETTLDYCSCMCCVKGLLYHCMKDRDMDNDVRCADSPCSCDAHRRCTRWGCVVALVPLLPCLLCYWPLKGCLKLCEMAYTECHSQGCRCGDAPPPPTQQRRQASPPQPVFAASGKKQQHQNNHPHHHHLDALPSKRLLDTSAIEC